MILPKKQVSFEESLFGFGAFLLKKISTPTSIDELWSYYQKAYEQKEYLVKFSYTQFIKTLDYLYIIGAIKETSGGLISYETDKS